MTDTAPNTPSVVERTRAIAAGAPVVAVHFLGRTAAFVLGEEAVVLVADKGDETRLAASLAAAPVILKALADLHAAPMIDCFAKAPDSLPMIGVHANLRAWWSRMQERASMRQTEPGL